MAKYEIRPRKDRRGFDLISEALPFGRLWYAGLDAVRNAIGYAKFFSRSHDAVIRVFDEAGNVIETHDSGYRLPLVQRRNDNGDTARPKTSHALVK